MLPAQIICICRRQLDRLPKNQTMLSARRARAAYPSPSASRRLDATMHVRGRTTPTPPLGYRAPPLSPRTSSSPSPLSQSPRRRCNSASISGLCFPTGDWLTQAFARRKPGDRIFRPESNTSTWRYIIGWICMEILIKFCMIRLRLVVQAGGIRKRKNE